MAGNTEYTLQVLECGESIRARAVFPKTFLGFDGHFPGSPLLPGFLHIQMALDTLREAGELCTLQEVAAARFIRPILPDVPVVVTITRSADENTYDVVINSDEEPCSLFTLIVQGTYPPE